MNKPSTATIDLFAPKKRLLWLAASVLLLAGGLMLGLGSARAQNAPAIEYSVEQLETLVGPIALYPDDLVAIVLPASTYPLQIVQAARLLEDLEDNPSLQPDPEWDDAVVALLNYPEVLRLMNEDLDWTWALGEAVLASQADVLDAIQGFRDRAYAAGNLRTDDRQIVTEREEIISIEPADPEVIYVPYYEPERVVVYQRRPVYHYYSVPYPVYYYPYPVGHHFHTGFFWGVTSAFSIGWHSHYLHVHPFTHVAHPYYTYSYYTPYYVRRHYDVNVTVNRQGYVWQPRHRTGARPDRRIIDAREGYSRQVRGDQRTGAVTRELNRGSSRVVNGRERLLGDQRAATPVRDPNDTRKQRAINEQRAISRVDRSAVTQQQRGVAQQRAREPVGTVQHSAPPARVQNNAQRGTTRGIGGVSRPSAPQRADRSAPQQRSAPQRSAPNRARAPVQDRAQPSVRAPTRAAQAPARAAPQRSAPARAPSATRSAPAPSSSRAAPSPTRKSSAPLQRSRTGETRRHVR